MKSRFLSRPGGGGGRGTRLYALAGQPSVKGKHRQDKDDNLKHFVDRQKDDLGNCCGLAGVEGTLNHLRAGEREGEDRQDKEDDLKHVWAGERRGQTLQTK